MAQAITKDREGLTLLELTVALAIFAIVMAVLAQALVSYYVALDIQNQRSLATAHCRSVLSDMREFRDTNTEPFPDEIVGHWPAGEPVPNIATLPNETVTVSYLDPEATPLDVTVTSQWADIRGRTMSLSIGSVLTDR